MDKTERKKRWEAEAALRRFEPVSDNEVLLAVERAERHRQPQNRDEDGVPWWEISEHLGFVRSGWTTRQLRPQIDGLVFGGLLETSRRHSRTYWALTAAARDRLATWRKAGEVIELHESPQHRTWRMARAYSAENLDRLRTEISSDLDRAIALLARGRRARSDAFFELNEHLSRRLRRLGSITQPVRVAGARRCNPRHRRGRGSGGRAAQQRQARQTALPAQRPAQPRDLGLARRRGRHPRQRTHTGARHRARRARG